MIRIHRILLAVVLCAGMVLGSALSAEARAVNSEVIEHGETNSTIYEIQQRLIDLGYLNYRPTGKFSDITQAAVRKFQQSNELPADGQIGAQTLRALFSDDAVRATRNPAFKSAVGRAYTGTVSDKGILSSWETISTLFPVGTTAMVTDYNTGERFRMRRTGGTLDAEVTTETQEDHEKYEYVFGGYSWEHRPVLVELNGQTYAASLFGMPTGTGDAGTTGMRGHTFLYFNNSKSDLLGIADEEHTVAITGISAS